MHMCQEFVNGMWHCPSRAKIKVTRPNPVDPILPPKYLCYSHLSVFIKHTTGQILIDKLEDRIEI